MPAEEQEVYIEFLRESRDFFQTKNLQEMPGVVVPIVK